MKAEAQLIALHEWLGWTQIRMVLKGAGGGNRKPTPHGVPPGRNYEAPLNTLTLDLMHEAEEKLKREDWNAFCQMNELLAVKILTPGEHIFHANKEQRLEAFLRAIGEWKEEESAVLA